MPIHEPNTIAVLTVSPHIVLAALAAFVVALIALYAARNSRR